MPNWTSSAEPRPYELAGQITGDVKFALRVGVLPVGMYQIWDCFTCIGWTSGRGRWVCRVNLAPCAEDARGVFVLAVACWVECIEYFERVWRGAVECAVERSGERRSGRMGHLSGWAGNSRKSTVANCSGELQLQFERTQGTARGQGQDNRGAQAGRQRGAEEGSAEEGSVQDSRD